MRIAFGWGQKAIEGYERMTGEGSQFIIFNQPVSVAQCVPSISTIFRKGKKMKTKHNQLRAALFAVTVLTLLASAITYADNIYVSCYGNGTIDKIDSSGNKSVFASGLNKPVGLAFDSRGNLWAAEGGTGGNGDGAIDKFDSTGNRSIFASGFNSLQSLAFDSSGNLYVSSYWDDTIEKFDSSGNRSIFATGLYRPEGLAFDSSGYLYLADEVSRRLKNLIRAETRPPSPWVCPTMKVLRLIEAAISTQPIIIMVRLKNLIQAETGLFSHRA